MAYYLSEKELIHRICNGFLTHDGYVNDKFIDIYKTKGIDIDEIGTKQVLNCVCMIIKSMHKDAIQLYPRDIRGSKVREIRMDQAMSLAELSRRSGVAKTTLNDIEFGRINPFDYTLKKIATALDVDIEDFK